MNNKNLLFFLVVSFLTVSCAGKSRVLIVKSEPADAEVCIKGKAKSEYFSNQKTCVGTTPFEAEKVTVTNPDGDKQNIKFSDVEGNKEKFYVVVSHPGYLSQAVEVPKWEHNIVLKQEGVAVSTPPATTSVQTTGASSDNPATSSVVKVTSDPAGASVSINDVVKGNTPLEIVTKPGSYRIKLEAAGYQSTERTVNLDTGQTINLNLSLNKK